MSNDKQQTAVDIAFEKLANQGLLITRDYKNLVAYRESKEMEKEQIIEANWEASEDTERANNYYEQTYGGNK